MAAMPQKKIYALKSIIYRPRFREAGSFVTRDRGSVTDPGTEIDPLQRRAVSHLPEVEWLHETSCLRASSAVHRPGKPNAV